MMVSTCQGRWGNLHERLYRNSDCVIHGLLASESYFCMFIVASVPVLTSSPDEVALRWRCPDTRVLQYCRDAKSLRQTYSQMKLLREGVGQESAVSRGSSRLHSIATSLGTRSKLQSRRGYGGNFRRQ
jgi:hypothetical protein